MPSISYIFFHVTLHHLLRVGNTISPILQVENPKYRQVKRLAQVHTSSMWQSQDLKACILAPDFMLITNTLQLSLYIKKNIKTYVSIALHIQIHYKDNLQ